MNIKNILSSGYTFSTTEYELKLKYILFNSLLILNITLVTAATFTRVMDAQYSQAEIDFIYIFLGTFTFFLARKSKLYFQKLMYFVIFFSFFIVTLSFFNGLTAISCISWYIVLLMTTFFLAGKRVGYLVFLLSLASIITIASKKYSFEPVDITLGIIPFFVALFFMHFFEQRNRDFKEQLQRANDSLLKNNNRLNNLLKSSNNEILKLTQILDNSPVSIIITDPNGNIEYANPWFTKLTQYSLQEAKGQNPRVLKSDLHNDKYYTTLWDDITHNHVWNGTFKNIKKDGTIYWESAIIAPVNSEEGELAHFIAIKQEITQQIYLKEKLIQQDKDRVENFEKTLDSFVKMIEERDTYTAGHSQRVAEYSKLIAIEMNVSNKECDKIYRAAILHDIGKIATPDNILLKPGKLTNLEYKLIQEHVTASYDILARIPMYKVYADIIIHHHEHYDGKGYPKGLSGDEIPLLSHIMIVADAFDAMTTNRIYKGRKNIAQALDELRIFSEKQFHPEVVKAAIKVLSTIELHETINQLPKSDLEKERFSYFYRDQVTNTYNSDYLRFILNQNHFNREYTCINALYMHNFSAYNTRHGWSEGDKLLNEFSEYLHFSYPLAQIFRIYGDDFILINTTHIEIDMKQFESLDFLKKNSITITHRHIDLREKDIINLEDLEEIKDI